MPNMWQFDTFMVTARVLVTFWENCLRIIVCSIVILGVHTAGVKNLGWSLVSMLGRAKERSRTGWSGLIMEVVNQSTLLLELFEPIISFEYVNHREQGRYMITITDCACEFDWVVITTGLLDGVNKDFAINELFGLGGG